MYLTLMLIFFELNLSQQQPTSIAEAMILDTEASVMANFEFLAHTDIDMEEEEGEMEDELYETDGETKPNKVFPIFYIKVECFCIE